MLFFIFILQLPFHHLELVSYSVATRARKNNPCHHILPQRPVEAAPPTLGIPALHTYTSQDQMLGLIEIGRLCCANHLDGDGDVHALEMSTGTVGFYNIFSFFSINSSPNTHRKII